MRTLIINSYAGSLTLGAHAMGADIIGSYEDANFGLPIQKANFPQLEFRDYRSDWPEQDLSETFVIAHPPCSAFSVQNSSWAARGIDSAAFQCTKVVLDYATRNRAVAIAIESVMGAMTGAWNVHQQFADEHGYNLYRILQNGAMFGAQWRERFWVVYVRKGAAPDKMLWTLKPKWQRVRDVVTGYEDGPSPHGLDDQLAKLKDRLENEAMCSPEDMSYFFDKQDPPHPTTGMAKVFHRRMFPDEDIAAVQKQYLGAFSSSLMCYINPNGMCGAILGSSWFYLNGRNLSETAYKLLMGFPANYVFPEGKFRKNVRTYLSKGVMPPVAQWIYGQVVEHLGERHRGDCTCAACGERYAYQIEMQPNQIADFRFRRRHWPLWPDAGTHKPALRHDDDGLGEMDFSDEEVA